VRTSAADSIRVGFFSSEAIFQKRSAPTTILHPGRDCHFARLPLLRQVLQQSGQLPNQLGLPRLRLHAASPGHQVLRSGQSCRLGTHRKLLFAHCQYDFHNYGLNHSHFRLSRCHGYLCNFSFQFFNFRSNQIVIAPIVKFASEFICTQLPLLNGIIL
jgi:hypothetical protein